MTVRSLDNNLNREKVRKQGKVRKVAFHIENGKERKKNYVPLGFIWIFWD